MKRSLIFFASSGNDMGEAINVKLRTLLGEYPYTGDRAKLDIEIRGINHDSRYIRPGEMYVCLKGLHRDGHDYAAEAAANGAVAVLAEKEMCVSVPVIRVGDTRHALSYLSDRYFARPSRKLHVVGVTGTNGKTTTTHFLQAVYRAAGYPCAVIGTVGVRLDDSYLAGGLTTPEAFDLHRTFHEIAGKQIEHVAMEVSSHSLAWKRVEHVRFAACVFTNLSHEHLDFHKTMENYFLTKAHLFSLQGKKGNRPLAVVNGDDEYGRRLLSMLGKNTVSYGMGGENEVLGRILDAGRTHTHLAVNFREHSFETILGLPGEFNAYNALAAAAVALAEGIGPDAVAAGLSALAAVPGRLEAVNYNQDFSVIIDFAHTPDSLERVLQTLSSLPHERLITVFGCPGERDRAKRPLMGRIAEHYSDIVVLTSDNPASEEPEEIIAEIVQGMKSIPVILPDRTDAVRYALSAARRGDIVLLAGKGHETSQIVNGKHIPYSDRRTVETFFISS